MITAGIDAGSRTLKMVLWNTEDQAVLAQGLTDQGLDQAHRLGKLRQDLLKQAKIEEEDISKTIATGYGRNAIQGADTVTEITCHAVGVRSVMPEVRTVIDIGGEDSKLIRLDNKGNVHDFAMNDRCAAGTGRFMEVVAHRLEVALDQLGALAAASQNPAKISSMCVVFAETEIIGLLASGTAREDIIAGVQEAIATRVTAMTGGRIAPPILFTGGGALVSGMHDALEKALNQTVTLCPDPQFTGARGAAILAAER